MRASLLSLIFIAASVAHGQVTEAWPSRGVAHSDRKLSAIVYECDQPVQDRLTCRFAELDVWKDLVVKGGGVMPTLSEQLCAEAKRTLESHSSRATSASEEYEEAVEGAKAVLEDCESGGTQARRAHGDALAERRMKNCEFVAHLYSQRFRRFVTETTVQWITDSKPEGQCGTIRSSRFVRDSSVGTGWNYIAEIKITRRAAQDGLLRCADLREFEERYYWQLPQDRPRAECKQVRLGSNCSLSDFPCLSENPVTVF